MSSSPDEHRFIGDCDLPRRLSDLRHIAGLTQRQVADSLGVSTSAVSRFERTDPMRLRLRSIQRYINALGATIEFRAVFPLSFPEPPLKDGAL